MRFVIHVFLVVSISLMMTACGSDGPISNGSPPKKPAWSNSYDVEPLR
jgi:predicted small lipoprotein YifL